MNRRDLTRFVSIKQPEEQNSKNQRFFETLDLLDFKDDLRYK